MTSTAFADRGPNLTAQQSALAHPLDRRAFLRLGLAAGASVRLPGLLAACGSDSEGAGLDTLTIGLERQLNTLDNKRGAFDTQVTVLRAMREALTAIGPDMQIVPAMAERMERVEPTVWEVDLRKGLVYSDGSPVRVEDVTAALEAYRTTPGSTFTAQQFPEWPAVRKVSEGSFTLTTKRPVPGLDYLMSNIFIIPAKRNKPDDVQIAPGTGPYIVRTFDGGQGTVELVPNERYRGGAPRVKSVLVRYIAEEAARMQALRTGQIDIATTLSPDSARNLEGDRNLTVVKSPGTRLVQFFYNFHKKSGEPIADPRVREALSYAIDGETLVNGLLQGAVAPVDGVIPETLVGAAKVGRFVYDPQRAKSMLAAAGAAGMKLRIIWQQGEFYSDSQVMEAVGGMLGEVGVKVSLKEFGAGDEILQWRQGLAGDWDVVGNGYGNQTGLAVTSLLGMFAGTRQREREHNSYQGYLFPEITTAIVQASSEPDDDRRERLLAEVQEQIWATWPAMWAFVQNNSLGARRSVSGLALQPDNTFQLAKVRTGA